MPWDYSYAIGTGAIASDDGAYAFGNSAKASGYKAYAFGYHCYATGEKAYAIGSQNSSTGETSVAIGHSADAKGNSLIAVGRNSQAEGYHSIAIGVSDDTPDAPWTTASGGKSIAIGTNCKSRQYGSVTLGYWLDNNDDYSLVVGKYNTPINTGSIFVVGNGSSDLNRSNAVVILDNGNLGIGTSTPDYKLQINGDAVPETNRGGDLGTSTLAWDVLYYNSAQVIAKSFTNKTLSEEILNFKPISLKNGTEKIDSESLPKELRGDKGYVLSNEMTTYNYKLNYEQQVLINKQQTQIEQQKNKNSEQQKEIEELKQQIQELKDLIQNK